MILTQLRYHKSSHCRHIKAENKLCYNLLNLIMHFHCQNLSRYQLTSQYGLNLQFAHQIGKIHRFTQLILKFKCLSKCYYGVY